MSIASQLIHQTLFSPRKAADRIMALWLPRDALWCALALVAVLNGIVYSIFSRIGPAPEGSGIEAMLPALQSPLVFTLFMLGGLIIAVFAMTWIGKAMGGAGELPQLLALIVWMQLLRLGVQLVLGVMVFILPMGAMALVLVTLVWGLVILVAFMQQAHGFDTVFKSIAVILFAFLAMIIGLSIILGVLGPLVIGGP